MTDIEISVLTLLGKASFVLVSALCIAALLKAAMAGKGWRSARPVLIWLAWVLVTWLGGFLLLVLANAHTHMPGKILVIRMLVAGYLVLATLLIIYILKRLRYGESPDADSS